LSESLPHSFPHFSVCYRHVSQHQSPIEADSESIKPQGPYKAAIRPPDATSTSASIHHSIGFGSMSSLLWVCVTHNRTARFFNSVLAVKQVKPHIDLRCSCTLTAARLIREANAAEYGGITNFGEVLWSRLAASAELTLQFGWPFISHLHSSRTQSRCD
jgi:hypothetical protein